MPLAHHNCVMTKQPHHSSDTRWHRDIRYWNFTSPKLVSVWLALGKEYPENGGLFVIPGSHRLKLQPSQLDESLFFREDVAENQPLLDSAVPVELAAGDVLFFHACTLHTASRNNTDQSKFSAVFTFRPADNPSISRGPDSVLADSERSGFSEIDTEVIAAAILARQKIHFDGLSGSLPCRSPLASLRFASLCTARSQGQVGSRRVSCNTASVAEFYTPSLGTR